MKSISIFLIAAGVLVSLPWVVSAQRSAASGSKTEKGAAATTAGPENGGLRMRMNLTTSSKSSTTGVEVEITNVSDKPVTLRGAWEDDDQKGDVKEYVEAAISIETTPAIQLWMGQVRIQGRSEPQPELTLKAGESLIVSWSTDGKELKNKVSNPLFVQNPEFPGPGLYAVRATLAISTGGEPVLLRSNEQFFAAGGSNVLPKSTFGWLREVDKDGTALINLGALEKIQAGDQFRLRTGYSEYYRLSITHTQPHWATGVLFPEPIKGELSREVRYPKVGEEGVLAADKMEVPARR